MVVWVKFNIYVWCTLDFACLQKSHTLCMGNMMTHTKTQRTKVCWFWQYLSSLIYIFPNMFKQGIQCIQTEIKAIFHLISSLWIWLLTICAVHFDLPRTSSVPTVQRLAVCKQEMDSLCGIVSVCLCSAQPLTEPTRSYSSLLFPCNASLSLFLLFLYVYEVDS